MVRKDGTRFTSSTSKAPLVLLLVGILGMISTGTLIFLRAYGFAAIAGSAGLVALVWGILEKISMKKRHRELLEKYGHSHWKHW